jgi:hypothetical protein
VEFAGGGEAAGAPDQIAAGGRGCSLAALFLNPVDVLDEEEDGQVTSGAPGPRSINLRRAWARQPPWSRPNIETTASYSPVAVGVDSSFVANDLGNLTGSRRVISQHNTRADDTKLIQHFSTAYAHLTCLFQAAHRRVEGLFRDLHPIAQH